MKRFSFYLVIGLLGLALVAVFGWYFGIQKFGRPKHDPFDQNGNMILVDGTVRCENMRCFEEKLKMCAPAEIELGGSMNLTMRIYGFENDRCHYEMHVGEKAGKKCFFAKDNLGGKILSQLFGENEGLKDLVDQNCENI